VKKYGYLIIKMNTSKIDDKLKN